MYAYLKRRLYNESSATTSSYLNMGGEALRQFEVADINKYSKMRFMTLLIAMFFALGACTTANNEPEGEAFVIPEHILYITECCTTNTDISDFRDITDVYRSGGLGLSNTTINGISMSGRDTLSVSEKIARVRGVVTNSIVEVDLRLHDYCLEIKLNGEFIGYSYSWWWPDAPPSMLIPHGNRHFVTWLNLEEGANTLTITVVFPEHHAIAQRTFTIYLDTTQ